LDDTHASFDANKHQRTAQLQNAQLSFEKLTPATFVLTKHCFFPEQSMNSPFQYQLIKGGGLPVISQWKLAFEQAWTIRVEGTMWAVGAVEKKKKIVKKM